MTEQGLWLGFEDLPCWDEDYPEREEWDQVLELRGVEKLIDALSELQMH